jgi:hypothetical protein
MTTPLIPRSEWRWAIGWSLALLVLLNLPYALALIFTPTGWQFYGFLLNPLDGHSYLAKMDQGWRGGWKFYLSFSPEAHEGVYIFTFYLALGHLARLVGWPAIVVFHLARLLSGAILLPITYRFIAEVTPHRPERRLVFILVLFTAGVSWLGLALGGLPIDLWVPEAFIHFSIYHNPHFALGLALMLLIFILILPAKVTGPRVTTLALLAFGLAVIMPFGAITASVVLLAYTGWRFFAAGRRLPMPEIWLTLVVGVSAAPITFYDGWISLTDPMVIGWSAQNITAAPPPRDVLTGFGLTGLLAIAGGWHIIRHGERRPGEWLVLLWAITAIGLLYTPFALQRRLIFGLHLPLCLLATMGLTRWLRPHLRRMAITLVVFVGVLGMVFAGGLPLIGVFQSPETYKPAQMLYLREDEVTALAWLRQHSGRDTVILASPRVGMVVPGQTGARVFYGHPFETVNAKEKLAQVNAFYRGEINAVSPPADYIFYGPSEKELGRPARLNSFTEVFTTGKVSIYRP